MSYTAGDCSYKAINFKHTCQFTQLITTVMLFTCCCHGTCCQPIRKHLSTDVGRQSSSILKVVQQKSANKKLGRIYVRRQTFVVRYRRPSKLGCCRPIFSFVFMSLLLLSRITANHSVSVKIYLRDRQTDKKTQRTCPFVLLSACPFVS